MEDQMLSKLLGWSVAVIGLLLMGPQKASADVVYACVNTTTGLIYIVSATANCPPASSGATWIKINWNATAGGQAPNVRYTPIVNVPSPNIASCIAINVNAQPRTIHVEIFNITGTVAENVGTNAVQPGAGFGGGNRTAGFFYCKFTVTDGISSDIRGSMNVCTNAACGLETVAAE
jgi:hypothetical protein